MTNEDVPAVEVLMATYNGEKYISEQIESILCQDYSNWELIIRDDGSVDKTPEIISNYAVKYCDKVKIMIDGNLNLGPTQNFARLISGSKAKYIMLCDQDDVWLKNKISLSVEKILEIEKNYSNIPILVFTDLLVVDKDLNKLNDSFWRQQKLNPEIVYNYTKFSALNVITGCTMIFNDKAKKTILPIPEINVFHDYWIGLKISYYGIVEFINTQTIMYRQHEKNVMGSNQIGMKYFYSKCKNFVSTFHDYKRVFNKLDFKINILMFIIYKLYFSVMRSIK